MGGWANARCEVDEDLADTPAGRSGEVTRRRSTLRMLRECLPRSAEKNPSVSCSSVAEGWL